MFFRSRNGKEGVQPAFSPALPETSAAPPAKAATAKSTAPDAAPAPARDKPLPPEDLKKRAEASQRLAATVGEIVGLMIRSPRHRDRKLSDLRWLVLPAVRAGQYALIQAQSTSRGFTAPVAAVLWAQVSAEVDKRLSENLGEPIRLGPREWKSGDILWLVDPIGDARAVAALVQRLRGKEWKGKPVKMRMTDADGQVRVRVIDQQATSTSSSAAAHSA
jgi:hemolysin-activating ACP:hemolysin acyltransferase